MLRVINKYTPAHERKENIMQFKDNALLLEFDSLPLSLTYEGGWRLRSAAENTDSGFDDMGAAQQLAHDLGEEFGAALSPLTLEENGAAEVSSAVTDSRVAITPESITFYGGDGEIRAKITSIKSAGGDLAVRFALTPAERVYGCGERLNRVNQRGKIVNIMAIDQWLHTEGNSYTPVPFVMTSRPVGIFMNRYEHSVFDIGVTEQDSLIITQSDAPIDLYVFVSDDPGEILRAYSALTGFSPEPAEWLYGIQVCRYAPDFSTPDGVYEMQRRMAENDFPWDAVIIEGWDTYNEAKFDALREMTSKLHADGKKVMLYSASGRVPANAEELGMKPEYVLPNGLTGERLLPETDSYNPADNPNMRTARYVDISSPEAREWWYGGVWGKLVNDIGVDGCKIDFCEQFPEFVPVAFSDGRRTKGSHHRYPTVYNALMFRLYNSKEGGGMCFSRGGGIGAQRYPFLWAGDQLREYGYLKVVLNAVLSAGFSGMPFMSYDMSAYRPARNGDPEDKVFLRDLEYTAFSANIQTHGVVTRPYDFNEHVKDCYRAYSKLHNAIKPYIIEQGRIACETGMPLMRHLFLYDCRDERVFDIEDEYMLGSSLLVCPVLDDRYERDIYLPRGRWQEIFTGETYEGGCELKGYKLPLESVAVFRLIGSDSEALEASLEAVKPFIDEINALSER